MKHAIGIVLIFSSNLRGKMYMIKYIIRTTLTFGQNNELNNTLNCVTIVYNCFKYLSEQFWVSSILCMLYCMRMY